MGVLHTPLVTTHVPPAATVVAIILTLPSLQVGLSGQRIVQKPSFCLSNPLIGAESTFKSADVNLLISKAIP